MVTKNILVDSALIGTMHFYAYVFNTDNGVIGFGLFPNNSARPIFYLLNSHGTRITLHFDEELILNVCQQSSFSTHERRLLFREFLDFATKMEKKAAQLVFRDTKMNYLADSREMVKYKRMYVHYKDSQPRENRPILAN